MATPNGSTSKASSWRSQPNANKLIKRAAVKAARTEGSVRPATSDCEIRVATLHAVKPWARRSDSAATAPTLVLKNRSPVAARPTKNAGTRLTDTATRARAAASTPRGSHLGPGSTQTGRPYPTRASVRRANPGRGAGRPRYRQKAFSARSAAAPSPRRSASSQPKNACFLRRSMSVLSKLALRAAPDESFGSRPLIPGPPAGRRRAPGGEPPGPFAPDGGAF